MYSDLYYRLSDASNLPDIFPVSGNIHDDGQSVSLSNKIPPFSHTECVLNEQQDCLFDNGRNTDTMV